MAVLFIGIGVYFLSYPDTYYERLRKVRGIRKEAFEVTDVMERNRLVDGWLFVISGVLAIMAALCSLCSLIV